MTVNSKKNLAVYRGTIWAKTWQKLCEYSHVSSQSFHMGEWTSYLGIFGVRAAVFRCTLDYTKPAFPNLFFTCYPKLHPDVR